VAALAQGISPANGRLPGRLWPLWDVGLIRHRFDGNSVGGAADRSCPKEIRMFFVFIYLQRNSRPCRYCRGSLRRDVGVKLRPQPASARTGEWMARRH
jgi:hypothetical protein